MTIFARKWFQQFLIIGATLGLILFNYGDYWSAHWYSKWTYLLWVYAAIFGVAIAKRTSYFFLPALWYILGNGIWIFASVLNHYKGVPKLMNLSLERNTAYSFIAFSMFAGTVAFFPKLYAKRIHDAITLVFLAAVLWTLASIDRIPYERGLLSGNASMQGCLIACLLPFVFHWFKDPVNKWMSVITGVTAIAILGASVPVGVLAVVLLAYYVSKRASFILPLGIIASVFWSAYWFLGPDFFSDNGRFYRWKTIMHWWGERFSPYIGAGFGTARSLLAYIQEVTNSVGGEYFIWMHSDWLQSYFELGIVGMFFVMIGWGYIAYRAINKPYLFATFMGFSASAIFDYPLRLPIHVAVLTFVVWLILQEGGIENGRKKEI